MEHLRLKKSANAEVLTDEQALTLLRNAYQRIESEHASSAIFGDAITRINWEGRSARLFEEAIGIALSLDAVQIARELAALGHETHPEDDYLRRAAKVLAPPKVIGTKPARKGLAESMNWLREHGEAYKNSWVAVEAGQFLGSAASRSALAQQIAPKDISRDVIVTFIP